MNLSQVKKQNRSAVLSHLLQRGPLSRKDIAECSGLTPAAVTMICNELLQKGLLEELGADPDATGAGRKKVLVDIAYARYLLLAVSIELTDTVLTVTDLRGTPLLQKSLPTDRMAEPEAFLRVIAASGKELCGRIPLQGRTLIGSSVTIPGVVERTSGVSVHAYGIWQKSVPVCSLLRSLLHMPVLLENNVDAFAKAEMLYGSGRKYQNLLILKWGPGVGAAIVIDGQIYGGRHGKAAELGHFIVDREGLRCNCGRRGCLETKVSYPALCKKQPFAMADFGKVYRGAVQDGQAEFFDDAIDLFARTVVNTMTILAPNRVILYGPMFDDDFVRAAFIGACQKYEPRYNAERILYSTLASQCACIGPVAVEVYSLLSDAG